MRHFFVKSHGLGNDYIVLSQSELDFMLTPEATKKICDVHYGIGSDGILLKVPSLTAHFGLRILNPDGSEAEKSGNGIRIFAKYLYDYRIAQTRRFTIETAGGLVQAEIMEEEQGKARLVRVDMGRALFRSLHIPVKSEKEECLDEMLHLEYKDYLINCVSVGNPHCVIFTEELDEDEVRTFGPQIENNPFFPNRVNVQFVRVVSPAEAEIMIWERGAGWTLASGSSSCAVAAVMVKKGLAASDITVKMPGGNLGIEIDDSWNIRMTGEVSEIANGTLSDELVTQFF